MNNNILDQVARQTGGARHKSKQREYPLNGQKYTIEVLPATAGLAVQQDLIKTFGPAFGVLLDKESIDPEYRYIDEQQTFMEIAHALVSRLDDFNFAEVCVALLYKIKCDGEDINFDEHFAGNYDELIDLVAFSLKENFGGLFMKYLKVKGLAIHTLRPENLMESQETQSESKS